MSRLTIAGFVILLLGAIGSVAGPAASQDDPPPIAPPEPIPPPAPIAPPPSDRPPSRRPNRIPVRTDVAHCQRCGYIVNDGWRYCPACGWDHRILAGDAAGEHLAKVQQSVMGIVVLKDKVGFEDFLSPEQAAQMRRYISGGGGQTKTFGTALPYGQDGLYVTSARILQRGKSVQLRNYQNHFFDAEIVAYDLPSGIGVVKADRINTGPQEANGLEQVTNERAWVICYPVASDEDLVRYLPASIHSGRLVDRGYFGTQLVAHENLLRTDHTLPDGCQGALLVDSLGTAAGIVLGSPDDGVTYVQPLNDVLPIIERLAKGEQVERPFYGMGLVAPDERHQARYDLPPGTRRPVVAYLIGGSPALAAGVRGGDILLAIDGEEVVDVPSAGSLLLSRGPGMAPVALTVRRGGAQLDFMVRPTARSARVLLDPIDEIMETLQANLREVKTGKSSGHGLRVEQLLRGGRGEKLGFRDGDVIRKVERKSVRDFAAFNRVISEENPDMFSDRQEEQRQSSRSVYILTLEVRNIDGEVRNQAYISLFPELFAPPVY